MFNRRQWLTLVPLAGLAGLTLPRRASATALVDLPRVAVPNNAIGAIVSATAGDLLEITIDSQLADDEIAIAGALAVKISERILRKGEGVARSRFLDDARNATKIGANVKTALGRELPDLAVHFDANHLAWAKPFANKALAWTKQLAKLGLGRVRDEHERIYLLEWAGATIDANAGPSPAGLARAPNEPDQPTLAAYQSYIGDLVAALS